MAVAGGKDFISGTFTTDNASSYTIQIGKTFSRYMYFVEMTAASKTNLLSSGVSAAKMYAFSGVYPSPEISNNRPINGFVSFRINPSNSELSISSSTAGGIDGSSITLTNNTFSNGSNNLYRGESYNYLVVSMD